MKPRLLGLPGMESSWVSCSFRADLEWQSSQDAELWARRLPETPRVSSLAPVSPKLGPWVGLTRPAVGTATVSCGLVPPTLQSQGLQLGSWMAGPWGQLPPPPPPPKAVLIHGCRRRESKEPAQGLKEATPIPLGPAATPRLDNWKSIPADPFHLHPDA